MTPPTDGTSIAARYQGALADGTWYLNVSDVKPGDTGLLGCAALTVDRTSAERAICV